jgi:hypothetical protein
MSEAEQLQSIGQTLASVADQMSAAFARELARVLTQAERALVPILRAAIEGDRTATVTVGRILPLRRELRAALERAGYGELAATASAKAVARMAEGFAGRSTNLGRLTPKRLEALARILEADLLGIGEAAAMTVWRSAALAIYSSQPVDQIVADLAEQLHTSLSKAQTIFDTQTSIVGRQMERLLTEKGDQAYLYVGPVDARTRDWCLERVGLVKTRDAIDQLDNGQLPNPFLTGGGYNCRHTWLAVSDPALVSLANGGVRAGGYEQRVAMAYTLKTQRKRFRELRRAA